MNFNNPEILHLLWLVPLLAGLLHWLYFRREKIIGRFVQLDLIDAKVRNSALTLARIKTVLILGFVALSVFALSRPQWGYQWQEVKRQGLDILIAVDVSKSMLTKDVTPSRLERTKLAIKDLVKKLKGDRVGLIAFAGEAFLVCPLTLDYNGFLLSLNDLSIDSIPRGGTDLSRAIDEAIKSYGKNTTDKAFVMVTDGEDNEGNAVNAAKRAKEKGIKIFTVGIGTREGDLIQITDDQGSKQFLKDGQGNVVKSHLNENLLQQISYTTGGAYVRSSGAEFGLDYIYERQLSGLKKDDIEQRKAKKYNEQYQWFIALGLLFLCIEGIIATWKE